MSPFRRSVTQALPLGAGSVASLGLGGCATAPVGEPTLDRVAREPSPDALARAKSLRFGSTFALGRPAMPAR